MSEPVLEMRGGIVFERQYVLVSFSLGYGDDVSSLINTAVADCDHERAPASVACMTSDGNQLHILIEQWRDRGDTEQDTTRAVDATATPRKSRRTRKNTNDDAGTAPRVEPESIDLPLESREVTNE